MKFQLLNTVHFLVEIPDSQDTIRVLWSQEPVEGEGLVHHVSCSVGHLNWTGTIRSCTDEELEFVKTLVPSCLQFEEERSIKNPHVRHLWEKK